MKHLDCEVSANWCTQGISYIPKPENCTDRVVWQVGGEEGETFKICKSQFWSQLASKTSQQKDRASAEFNTRCQEVLIEEKEEKEWWLCSMFDPKIHISWPCIMHSPHKYRHNLFLVLRVAILILSLHAWAYLAKMRGLCWKVCLSDVSEMHYKSDKPRRF